MLLPSLTTAELNGLVVLTLLRPLLTELKSCHIRNLHYVTWNHTNTRASRARKEWCSWICTSEVFSAGQHFQVFSNKTSLPSSVCWADKSYTHTAGPNSGQENLTCSRFPFDLHQILVWTHLNLTHISSIVFWACSEKPTIILKAKEASKRFITRTCNPIWIQPRTTFQWYWVKIFFNGFVLCGLQPQHLKIHSSWLLTD